MRKKVLASIMAVTLVFSLFTGCGNKDENESSDVETGGEEASEIKDGKYTSEINGYIAPIKLEVDIKDAKLEGITITENQ